MITPIEEMWLRLGGLEEADIQVVKTSGIEDDIRHIVATYAAVKPRIDRVLKVCTPILQRVLEKHKAWGNN